MTRPSLIHDGFLIPNASDVTNPRMAEPDRIDFNTLAHARWGVVEGCLITVSGSTAQCALGGLVLVNSRLVNVASGQTVNIGVGGAQDRFDLIVVDDGGSLLHVSGTPATDPVFPDPPANTTVLAAVFAPTGTANLSDNVIDKRKFVSRSLLTKIDSTDPLVQNLNGSGNHYLVSGGGLTTWEGDTILQRSAPFTLRVTRNLVVDDTVTAGGDLTAKSLKASPGTVTGSNLVYQSALPSSAENGTLLQTLDGRLYIRKSNMWKEIATLEGAVPVGSVIQSVEPPSVMQPLGWVPLNGATVTESQYPALFTLASLQQFVTGVSPNRSMKLPNAENRVFMTRWTVSAFSTGGRTNNQVTLDLAHMPKHKHGVALGAYAGGAISASIGRAGDHIHGMTKGGRHIHAVRLYDHIHYGMDNYGNPAPVIAVAWGGRNKIDALFNDRNHTYSVEKAEFTMPAKARVDVLETDSEHAHTIQEDGDHTHPISGTFPGHNHPVTELERGSGSAFDITPSYLSLYTYIRS